jgi:VCBS repeat protein
VGAEGGAADKAPRICEDFQGVKSLGCQVELQVGSWPNRGLSRRTNRLPTIVGAGGFSAAGSPVGVGVNPISLTAADLNGDGKPDLAIANGESNDVSILVGDGAGGFSAAGSPVAAGSYPLSLAAADLNGDGKPDLAIANGESNDVSILVGTARAASAPPAHRSQSAPSRSRPRPPT